MERYRSYTAKDFLQDEYFIEWQLLQSEEHNRYWEEVLATYPHLADRITEAQYLFRQAVRLNDHETDVEEEDLMYIQFEKRVKRKVIPLYIKMAASIAAIAIVVFLFMKESTHTEITSEIAAIQSMALPSFEDIDEIRLITEDSIIILADNAELTYHELATLTQQQKETEEFNKLIVPYGKRSFIALSDGTKVWVNSGTVVQFPKTFDGKEERNIMVSGEIYIEVEKDENRPFRIQSPHYDVEVLGTKFNVSAYPQDTESHVVLVEGAVQINTSEDSVRMYPNQMFTKTKGTHTLRQVDVQRYISWKNGWLQLESIPLEQLASRLSKYYGKTIVCDESVKNLTSSGKLFLFDNVDKLLNTISKNMHISYRYEDDVIRLERK